MKNPHNTHNALGSGILSEMPFLDERSHVSLFTSDDGRVRLRCVYAEKKADWPRRIVGDGSLRALYDVPQFRAARFPSRRVHRHCRNLLDLDETMKLIDVPAHR